MHATARWSVQWPAWLGQAAWVAAALLVVACGGLCVAAGRGLIESGSWAVGLAVVLKGVAVLLVGCFVRWVVWDRSRVLKAQEVVILGTALVPPTTLEAIRDDTTLTPVQRELLRREYLAVPANESAGDSARE